ncbi:MAG: hypothetical protein AB7P33_10705 [Dehalococcoidia bacterium]
MNPDAELLNYIEARKRFFDKLDVTRGRLDRLLNEMLERPATLNDLARLEGLHQEKHALFTDFVATEDRFVSLLLSRRAGRPESGK